MTTAAFLGTNFLLLFTALTLALTTFDIPSQYAVVNPEYSQMLADDEAFYSTIQYLTIPA